MAIQNQGFRRDLNLLETEDDRNAIDNLAGAGTNKDLAFLQNNLRNTSSIPFYTVDSDGFFSTANDRVIEINGITGVGTVSDNGDKSTTVTVTLVNPFLIKFGDLVKINGVTGIGSTIFNGSFTVRGTSDDLKAYTFVIDDINYSETITSVTGIGFSISSSDVFSFTKDDVVNVDKEVKLVSTAATVFSPNTDYYVSESDGFSKFKLSTTPSTVGFNTVTITGGASLTPDNFIFSRKDAVHQQQVINYIQPEIQDNDFSYLEGTVNDSMDSTQAKIESAEFFMGKGSMSESEINRITGIPHIKKMAQGGPGGFQDISSTTGIISRLPSTSASSIGTNINPAYSYPMFDNPAAAGGGMSLAVTNNTNNQGAIFGEGRVDDIRDQLAAELSY